MIFSERTGRVAAVSLLNRGNAATTVTPVHLRSFLISFNIRVIARPFISSQCSHEHQLGSCQYVREISKPARLRDRIGSACRSASDINFHTRSVFVDGEGCAEKTRISVGVAGVMKANKGEKRAAGTRKIRELIPAGRRARDNFSRSLNKISKRRNYRINTRRANALG